MTTSDIIFAGVSLVQSLVILLALVQIMNLRKRYDRFRAEVGQSFDFANQAVGNINDRLTAAGYPPPGEQTQQPLRTYPAWAARR